MSRERNGVVADAWSCCQKAAVHSAIETELKELKRFSLPRRKRSAPVRGHLNRRGPRFPSRFLPVSSVGAGGVRKKKSLAGGMVPVGRFHCVTHFRMRSKRGSRHSVVRWCMNVKSRALVEERRAVKAIPPHLALDHQRWVGRSRLRIGPSDPSGSRSAESDGSLE
jgi:hypothetical protein